MRMFPAVIGLKPRTSLALYRPIFSLPTLVPNASPAAFTAFSSARWANPGVAEASKMAVTLTDRSMSPPVLWSVLSASLLQLDKCRRSHRRTVTFGLWQGAASVAASRRWHSHLRYRHHWIFCVAALAVWLALGWPVLQNFVAGAPIRGAPVSPLWLGPFALFGAAVLGAMVLKLRTGFAMDLAGVQVAAVAAMAFLVPWAMMSLFLIITAWQAAMADPPARALGWVAFQTLAVIGALAQALNPDMCWVLGLSFALQLFFVLHGPDGARALAQTNCELRAAQAIIANTVRDAERLRISRELHDAWGHELTALGLQLEIASHVTEPGRANDHVMQAKGLARALLAKVRDVVATLREAERVRSEGGAGGAGAKRPDAGHSCRHLTRRAGQPRTGPRPDALRAGSRHQRRQACGSIQPVASGDLGRRRRATGRPQRRRARPAASAPGSGLLGMRERVECLGGKLAVRAGADPGFTVDAWLPSRAPQAA